MAVIIDTAALQSLILTAVEAVYGFVQTAHEFIE